MRRLLVTLVLLLAPHPGWAQVTIVTPGSTIDEAIEQNYGPPREADLEDIAEMMPERYQRAHLILKGQFSIGAGQHWVLRKGGSRVLAIPGRYFDEGQFSRSVGQWMEVRGIVRVVRPKQYVGKNPPRDLDLVQDPLLPPMPEPEGVPPASITVLSVREVGSFEDLPAQRVGGGLARRILEEPSAYAGRVTKILGQFRGRNLFGDLPVDSARGKNDWVVKDGDTACWVTGKAPRGEGWKLDLDYKGDSKTWLEVEGKAEVVNGIVYLKATSVVPSKAPGDERRGATPR